MEEDMVNHPSHYADGNIECIDAIEASMTYEAFCGYLKGNILKYTWRYEKKGKASQDLKKAHWYQNKLIEVTDRKENQSLISSTFVPAPMPGNVKSFNDLKKVKYRDKESGLILEGLEAPEPNTGWNPNREEIGE